MADNDSKNTLQAAPTDKLLSPTTAKVLGAVLVLPTTAGIVAGDLTLSDLNKNISAQVREISRPRTPPLQELINNFKKGIIEERAATMACRTSKTQRLIKDSDDSFKCVTR